MADCIVKVDARRGYAYRSPLHKLHHFSERAKQPHAVPLSGGPVDGSNHTPPTRSTEAEDHRSQGDRASSSWESSVADAEQQHSNKAANVTAPAPGAPVLEPGFFRKHVLSRQERQCAKAYLAAVTKAVATGVLAY
eukprot:TRINITY_DN4650_c0_g1_i1.p1 TRINITY_DN4650_c0_g1~~TRINITY_DN4650_c0_g1_i1.p1  ORF type:complete len:160 (+),score=27.00 TRINITY_DN4650_c0_g1_i1:75-482(+)